jgi:hypothetical protein
MKQLNLGGLAENKYNRLLVVLVLGLLFYPFLDDTWFGGAFLILTFFLVCVVTILLVIRELEQSRRVFNHYICLGIIFFLCRIVGTWLPLPFHLSKVFSTISAIIFMFLLGLSIYLILCEIFPSKQVKGDTIKGGICVYLLIGFFWASFYDVVYDLDPTAFRSLSGVDKQANLIYFSFTTLTTTGYGDIAPASQVSRALANVESIMGVMYPAILIARLVSIYSIAQEDKRLIQEEKGLIQAEERFALEKERLALEEERIALQSERLAFEEEKRRSHQDDIEAKQSEKNR